MRSLIFPGHPTTTMRLPRVRAAASAGVACCASYTQWQKPAVSRQVITACSLQCGTLYERHQLRKRGFQAFVAAFPSSKPLSKTTLFVLTLDQHTFKTRPFLSAKPSRDNEMILDRGPLTIDSSFISGKIFCKHIMSREGKQR